VRSFRLLLAFSQASRQKLDDDVAALRLQHASELSTLERRLMEDQARASQAADARFKALSEEKRVLEAELKARLASLQSDAGAQHKQLVAELEKSRSTCESLQLKLTQASADHAGAASAAAAALASSQRDAMAALAAAKRDAAAALAAVRAESESALRAEQNASHERLAKALADADDAAKANASASLDALRNAHKQVRSEDAVCY
jgi:hypothetical protein